jgi:hypothetical protein
MNSPTEEIASSHSRRFAKAKLLTGLPSPGSTPLKFLQVALVKFLQLWRFSIDQAVQERTNPPNSCLPFENQITAESCACK